MAHNSTHISDIVSQAKQLFATALSQARRSARLSQQVLSEKAGLSRVMIAKYEGAKATPDSDKAVELAIALGADPAQFMLIANVQRLANATPLREPVFKRMWDLVQRHSQLPRRTISGPPNHLSLVDFPAAFTPLTIIVGARREEIPQNVGDLFAFSASTVDDRWIFKLGLPEDTEKICDKAVISAWAGKVKDEAWIQEHLGNRHVMFIGSGASNLCSRQWNKHFLFPFAVAKATEDSWQQQKKDIWRLEKPADLSTKRDALRADLKQTMRMFKLPGFIDFNYMHLKLGIDPSFNLDFGVVSLGTNPFAKPGTPYFAILAAGVHHPGTALAVRHLGDPRHFIRHPLGGILEIHVPGRKHVPQTVKWHDRIEKSDAIWHSAGNAKLEYEPEVLRQHLEQWLNNLEMIKMTGVEITQEDIKRHITLIDLLETGKGH